MPTVYEVAVKGTNNGQEHNNIFHVYDGDDNANMADIANTFLISFITALLPVTATVFTFTEIAIKSLTAANPGLFNSVISLVGTAVGDSMPTGIHLFIKLISGDIGFRAGGKLLGGSVENSWVNGEPTNAYMDAVQAVLDALIVDLVAGPAVDLAIYRPSLSVPGFPQISITPAALVRGNSTNNRRRKPFER